MGVVGIPRAIQALGATVYSIVTVVFMGLLGFVATHGTNKGLARIVGKERFANVDFATSVEMDSIRGVVYLGLLMLLYAVTWYSIPLIPRSLAENFSWLTGFASASDETLVFSMLALAVLLIVSIGVYHASLQKNSRQPRLGLVNQKKRARH